MDVDEPETGWRPAGSDRASVSEDSRIPPALTRFTVERPAPSSRIHLPNLPLPGMTLHSPLSRRFCLGALAAAGWLAASPALGAAQTRDTLVFTLDSVFARVRADHPALRAGNQLVAAAEARGAQLRRYPNPAIEMERATLSGVDNVSLVQPIRWPWEGAALKGIGAADVATARADSDAVVRETALDAGRRFLEVLRRAGLRELAAQAESLATRALTRAQSARELGQTGDLAVLQAQVSLDAARRARIGAETDYQASATVLRAVLGMDPATPLVLQGDLAMLVPLAAPDSALMRARAADPQSARLAAEANLADQEARLARARRWPTLRIGPAASFAETRSFGMTLGIELPLWNRQGAAIRAATAAREAALARLEARRRELEALARATTSTLALADRSLALLRAGELARSEQAQNLAEQALQQGGPYLAMWLAARQAYLDARRAELELTWQAADARLVLRSLAGTLLREGER